jgi:hypothetical protein
MRCSDRGAPRRLGNRAERRGTDAYLDAAPTASDREAVAARIAGLAATPIDAGVGSGSNLKPSTASRARPLQYCQCIPIDRRDGRAQLCKAKLAPKCRCQLSDGVVLCPVPFVPCPGSGCGEWSAWDGWACPQSGYAGFALPGAPGGACTGFATAEEKTPSEGQFRCLMCAEAVNYPFRGHPGDRCDGFDHIDGRPVVGELYCVAKVPPGG